LATGCNCHPVSPLDPKGPHNVSFAEYLVRLTKPSHDSHFKRKSGFYSYWRNAGSWEIAGLGIIAAILIVGMGRG